MCAGTENGRCGLVSGEHFGVFGFEARPLFGRTVTVRLASTSRLGKSDFEACAAAESRPRRFAEAGLLCGAGAAQSVRAIVRSGVWGAGLWVIAVLGVGDGKDSDATACLCGVACLLGVYCGFKFSLSSI